MKLPWIAAILLCVLASAAAADSGRDLVRVCGQSASLCGSDFQSDEVMAALKSNTCLPADAGSTQTAIVRWLGKHPRTARQDTAKAVATAAAALWPCKGHRQ